MSSFADLVKNQKKETVEAAPVQAEPISATDKLKNVMAEKKGESAGGFSFGLGKQATPAPKKENIQAAAVLIKDAVAEMFPEGTSTDIDAPPEPGATTGMSVEDFTHPEQPEKYSEKQVETFKKALQFMRDSLEHPETVIQMMKQILKMIEDEGNLVEFLMPEDGGIMTRTLRKSYGIEIAKKDARSTKKAANQKQVNEVLDLLGDVDLGV